VRFRPNRRFPSDLADNVTPPILARIISRRPIKSIAFFPSSIFALTMSLATHTVIDWS
jgi:hypothetical protein